MAGKLKIATCQFAVGGSIKRNANQIRSQMLKARKGKADIIHFPECALSGYMGTDFPSFKNYDWQLLRGETESILALAKKLKLWVVLGSSHQLTEPNKPHNCLYLISDQGKIINRYDKRFCTSGDLKHFTTGSKFVNFSVKGVKCSLLICYDLRFPELYRELWKQGVECILQSFYNARQKAPSVHSEIMRQTMQCRAATNYFWISMTNPSGYYSPYASCFIQPDGRIIARLKSNRAGVMVNTVDTKRKFYDAPGKFRKISVAGKLSNGPAADNDPRSKNRKVF